MYYDNSIRFPALGLSFNPPRAAFYLFGTPIYWYGLIIALGFFLGMLYAFYRIKRSEISEDNFLTMLIISLPVAIICARAYYVIFNLSLYIKDGRFDFLSAIAIRDGGLAIYGGIIGGFVCALIYCHIKKIPFLKVADIVSVSFLIGQGVGRWGNFINREAYGALTSLPWGMEIYDTVLGTRVTVHPTFLYESIWNLAGALILGFYYKKRKFNGEGFLWYIAWYGLGRAFIEGLRTDSLYLFGTGIRVSQLLAAVSCVVAVVLIIIIRTKKYKNIGGK